MYTIILCYVNVYSHYCTHNGTLIYMDHHFGFIGIVYTIPEIVYDQEDVDESIEIHIDIR